MVAQSKGLGDTVHRITSVLKIPHCTSCAERKKFLNALVPYKRKVNMKDVPTLIDGVRIRHLADGSFSIPRKNNKIEKIMDGKYMRISKLRWTFHTEGALELETVKPFIEGKKVIIVGKGPSLDYVTKKDFEHHDGLIICINESIHKINGLGLPNKLLALQLDGTLQDSCFAEGCGILVSERAQNWYSGHTERYVFNQDSLRGRSPSLSVVCAIGVCKTYGVRTVELFCFDACVDGSLDYATCIGYAPSMGGKPTRFLNHKTQIKMAMEDTPYIYITPKVPVSSSPDTPQPLPDNPVEHHEPQTPPSVASPAKKESTWNTEPSERETKPDHSDTEQQS